MTLKGLCDLTISNFSSPISWPLPSHILCASKTKYIMLFLCLCFYSLWLHHVLLTRLPFPLHLTNNSSFSNVILESLWIWIKQIIFCVPIASCQYLFIFCFYDQETVIYVMKLIMFYWSLFLSTLLLAGTV